MNTFVKYAVAFFLMTAAIAAAIAVVFEDRITGKAATVILVSSTLSIVSLIAFYLWREKSAEKARLQAFKKKQERDRYEQAMEEKEKQDISDELRPLMAAYLPVLARKEKYLRTRDDYGNESIDAWWREIDGFMDATMPRKMPAVWAKIQSDPSYWRMRYKHAIGMLVVEFLEHASCDEVGVNVDNLTPNEYEHHCASILGSYGWAARATKASGDQGADVVADYQGVRVVFQCKKYSQPVGNDAVQQVHASKAIYGANVAAVITNHTYTPAARQLAAAANVHLLHHDDLPVFAERLGLQ